MLQWLLTNIKRDLIKNCEICEDLFALLKASRTKKQVKQPKLRHPAMYVDLYRTELLYGRLFTNAWSAIPFDQIRGLLEMIGRIREHILFFQKLWDQVQNRNLDGEDMLPALRHVCQLITVQKKGFQTHWDSLIASLAHVKIVKTTHGGTKRKTKKQNSKAKE